MSNLTDIDIVIKLKLDNDSITYIIVINSENIRCNCENINCSHLQYISRYMGDMPYKTGTIKDFITASELPIQMEKCPSRPDIFSGFDEYSTLYD